MLASSMLKNRIAFYFELLFASLLIISTWGYEINEVDLKPKVVSHLASWNTPVKLSCKRLKKLSSVDEIYWQFKPCGEGLNIKPCREAKSDQWQFVMCKKKECGGYTLILPNSSYKNNGLYRCLHKNYMSKTFKVFEVFQLEVVDEDEPTIEILDEKPEWTNRTANINDTVLFRCRVKSYSLATMKWMKLVTAEHKRNVVYQNQTYKVLDGFPYKASYQTYVTKLSLKDVQLDDSGFYLCFAMNEGHIINKVYSLTVLPQPNIFEISQVLEPWLTPFTICVIFYFAIITQLICCCVFVTIKSQFRSHKLLSDGSSSS